MTNDAKTQKILLAALRGLVKLFGSIFVCETLIIIFTKMN